MQTNVTTSMQANSETGKLWSWRAHTWSNLEAMESHDERAAKHYGGSQVDHAHGQ